MCERYHSGHYTQTRPVWDCHRTADQLTPSQPPLAVKLGSPDWQSQTRRVWDKEGQDRTNRVDVLVLRRPTLRPKEHRSVARRGGE